MGRAIAAEHVTRWYKDQPDVKGFWGEPSATLDWSSNYAVSHYVAEFFNTFSNLFFIYLSLAGILRSYSQGLTFSLQLAHGVIGLVGLGSFFFHATLSYEWQLADELPMVFAASTVLYIVLALPKDSRTPVQLLLIRTILPLFAITLSVVYAGYYPNPVLHQVGYGLVQTALTARAGYVARSSWGKERVDEVKLSQIKRLFRDGIAIFLLGFAVWNVDNLFCDEITKLKKAAGPPLAWLLEGHAWWHIFTGYGSFLSVVGIQYLACCINEGQDRFTLRGNWFPWVERLDAREKKE
ncbi:alkaline phytoceramidase [Atractiella rhizophila]|nr:alkaline phytoceramidase [Atractiella rhizophila]